MRNPRLLLAASVAVFPAIATAQPISGLYIGAGAGANFLQDERVKNEVVVVPTSPSAANFAGTSSATTLLQSNVGAAVVTSIGYGFANGLRIEAEADYRYNTQEVPGFRIFGEALREQKFGGMANVLYDFNVGLRYLYPYVGLGAGYMHIDHSLDYPSKGSFAYQAIVGLAIPVPGVPGLSATVEYRFQGMLDAKAGRSPELDLGFGGFDERFRFPSDYNHSLLLGVRYAFGRPRPAPVAPPPTPAPAPVPTRSFLIFFDWDRADLSDRARQIVAEAARTSTQLQATRLEVQGNADSSGTPQYNQRLSLRRAQTVAAELVRDGVPATAIDIQAFGDTRPLVPTAPGVREPQNRRVQIILR